jgi:putative oxidoreductase
MRQNLPMTLIRVIVGLIFLVEGILKFLHPVELGSGLFAGIGLPFPQYLGPLVGGIEIFGGAAILVNLYAGDAALLLLLVILTALITTKLPILIGGPIGPFPVEKLPHYGLLMFLHEARVDLCMIFGSVAVLINSGLRFVRRRQWWQSRDL